MTVVPGGFSGERAEKTFLCLCKLIPLVTKYPMPAHARGEQDLLESIEGPSVVPAVISRGD